jgi:hypothetical protein
MVPQIFNRLLQRCDDAALLAATSAGSPLQTNPNVVCLNSIATATGSQHPPFIATAVHNRHLLCS